MGATEKVFGSPIHPYTKSLLACVPQLHSRWGPEGSFGGVEASCFYHERIGAPPAPSLEVASRPTGARNAPSPLPPSPLVEAEPDHLVGCFGCSLDTAA
jgi:peptide/nickel transport system ATP-binding protein